MKTRILGTQGLEVSALGMGCMNLSFGTIAADAPLEQMTIARREVLAKDIEIEILYCGVCHSDLHTVKKDWRGTLYPAVPGHEIVGRVTKVGSEVTKLQVGDLAGIGCKWIRETENLM